MNKNFGSRRRVIKIWMITAFLCGVVGFSLFKWRFLARKLVDSTRVILDDKPKGRDIIVLDWTGFDLQGNTTYHEDDCMVTRDRSLLDRSHAVVIVHRQQTSLEEFPQTRHIWQRWVWLLDESPLNTMYNHDYNLSSLTHAFNWTMTYRTTSDVYIPYGWTIRTGKRATIPDYIGNRTQLAVAVISNCEMVHNDRFGYIRRLQMFASVDLYGRCSGVPCGEYSRGLPLSYCSEVRNYLFYLAFENSNCKEYITEKLFSHGFEMGAVPVVMGAPKEDYLAITPPNSFIYAQDFASPAELGKYLTFLAANKVEYMKYYEWRKQFVTASRLQYITVKPIWSSLCRALRHDDGKTKLYEDLSLFWRTQDCVVDL